MAEIGAAINKMTPALGVAGGMGATAMGQPELGLPMMAGGMGATPGAQQGLAGLGMVGQGMMQGGQQQPPQPPQMPPRPPPAPMPQAMPTTGVPQAPPQAAGTMMSGGQPQPMGAGGGVPPQFAAMIRQMLLGQGQPGMG